MVELIVNGETLELDYKTNIKYTKQISDIFDIAKSNASYTNSFSVPKTPNNTRIFQGLGLVGSTSQVPYQKIPASLKEDGFDVIHNGWLEVKETTDVYKLNVIDGVIDFFKDIENINIGDLDLSEIDHNKTLQSVIASFSNDNYRYIIADYNGKTFTGETNTDINIDYIVPSARYKYLLEKIFTSFGWTWSGSIFNNEDYLKSWVTYPKSTIVEDDEPLLIATMNKGQFVDSNPVSVNNFNSIWRFDNVTSWDSSNLDEGTLLDNWRYEAPEDNSYLINVKARGFFLRKRWNQFAGIGGSYVNGTTVFQIIVKRNGQQLGQPLTVYNIDDVYQTTYSGYLQAGDVIDFEFRAYTANYVFNPDIPISLNLQFAEVNISRNQNPDVSFSEQFKNFKITDFFNDFIRRFGLTMIPDNDNRHLSFYTLSERLNTSNSVDWSEKYVRRTNESYLFGSYAQNNYYRHKYNGENEDFNDGILEINNKNLQNEKTLASSPFYSRTEDMTTFVNIEGENALNRFVYPIWSREPKETENGIEISYKSLSGRFYVIKDTIMAFPLRLVSELTEQELVVPVAPIIDSSFTHYADLIPKYYDKYYQLLNNCKIHKIEVAHSVFDIINLDFSKPIYFEQEASHYLINKEGFESGKLNILEAIKINI